VRSWGRAHPLLAFVFSLLLVTLCVCIIWGWQLSSRLDSKRDELRRQGRWATLSDVVIEPVPDGSNAWLAYMQAHAAMDLTVESPRQSSLEYPNYPPRGAKWEVLAGASERANSTAFPLARRARELPGAQLRSGPLSFQNIFQIKHNDARNLANVLTDGAMFAHHNGQHGEAVERVLDVLRLARIMRQDPALISQLVGIGIDAMALETVQQIAPTLAIADSSTNASDAQVRALIATLLDEDIERRGLVQSMEFERAATQDYIEIKAKGTIAIRPLADWTRLRWLKDFDVITEAVGQPTNAAAQSVLARCEMRHSGEPDFGGLFGTGSRSKNIPDYLFWFEDMGSDPYKRIFKQHYHESAERRVTTVIVAMQLYRRDHGRWPNDLAALVPAYLPAVPLNPCLDGNRPLGYVIQHGVLPNGKDRPLIYFDTEETVDDVIDIEPMYGWQTDRRYPRGGTIRQYRDVTLWMPAEPRFGEAAQLRAAREYEQSKNPDAPWDDDEQEPDAEEPQEE
jgi:hypothetical protein